MARRFLFTAAVLFLLIPTILFAQSDATVEFYGTIQSANATALVVNGQIVDISAAQVETPLVVGMTVRITASYAEDGSLTAQSVEPVAPGIVPGVVTISGEITDLTDNTITVAGQTITVSGVSIRGTLTLAQAATIYAVATAPGSWNALIVVAGRSPTSPVATPEVVSTPEISAPNATPDVVSTPEISAPLATPEVAAPVATPEVVSTPEVTAEESETFVIQGTLTAIGSHDILVDGKRYDISSVQVDGTLVVGAHVRLELQVLNGQAVLKEIKVTAGSGSNSSGGSGSGSGSGGSDG